MRWLLLCIGACVVFVALNTQVSGGATTQKLSWTILVINCFMILTFILIVVLLLDDLI